MKLALASKLGLPTLALAAALISCTDTVAPTATFNPTNGATGVDYATVNKIVVTFSEAMNTSVKPTITFSKPTPAPAVTTSFVGDSTFEIKFSAALAASTVYTYAINGGQDVAGNAFAGATNSFTTKASAAATTVSLSPSKDGSLVKSLNSTPAGYTFYPISAADPALLQQSFRVGNANTDAVARGVLRFAMPSGTSAINLAKVAKAELVLTQREAGTTPTVSPWSRGLSIKGVDFGTDLAGAAADFQVDYDAAVTAGNTFNGPTTDPGNNNSVTIDVTNYVKTLGAKTNADFRVEFGGERTAVDTVSDSSIRFHSQEALTVSQKPVLKLTVNP